MKKVLVILILINSWLVLNGQTGRPCAPYDQNRDISGMRSILMTDGVFYQNLRAAYAEAINYSVGKDVVTTSKYGMETILENTVLLDVNFVIPSDYLNGVRFGDEIKFTTLTGQPSDKWAAFRFNGVDYIYAKVSCMNPQKPKVPGVYTEEKKEVITPTTSWVYKEPKKEVAPILYTSPVKEEREQIKIGWVVIPIAAIVMTSAYFIIKSNNNSGHTNGNPGGSPSTRDQSDSPTEDPGGPGGSPTTNRGD